MPISPEGGGFHDQAELFASDAVRQRAWLANANETSLHGSVLLREIADVLRLRVEDGPNLLAQGSSEEGARDSV